MMEQLGHARVTSSVHPLLGRQALVVQELCPRVVALQGSDGPVSHIIPHVLRMFASGTRGGDFFTSEAKAFGGLMKKLLFPHPTHTTSGAHRISLPRLAYRFFIPNNNNAAGSAGIKSLVNGPETPVRQVISACSRWQRTQKNEM